MTPREEATRDLMKILDLVHKSASGGRAMTPELKTKVAELCYDIVAEITDEIGDRYAIVRR